VLARALCSSSGQWQALLALYTSRHLSRVNCLQRQTSQLVAGGCGRGVGSLIPLRGRASPSVGAIWSLHVLCKTAVPQAREATTVATITVLLQRAWLLMKIELARSSCGVTERRRTGHGRDGETKGLRVPCMSSSCVC
jgi:hypothetical protein